MSFFILFFFFKYSHFDGMFPIIFLHLFYSAFTCCHIFISNGTEIAAVKHWKSSLCIFEQHWTAFGVNEPLNFVFSRKMERTNCQISEFSIIYWFLNVFLHQHSSLHKSSHPAQSEHPCYFSLSLPGLAMPMGMRGRGQGAKQNVFLTDTCDKW